MIQNNNDTCAPFVHINNETCILPCLEKALIPFLATAQRNPVSRRRICGVLSYTVDTNDETDPCDHCIAYAVTICSQIQITIFDPALKHYTKTRRNTFHRTWADMIGKGIRSVVCSHLDTRRGGAFMGVPRHEIVTSETWSRDGAPWQLDAQSRTDKYCYMYCIIYLQSILSGTNHRSRDDVHKHIHAWVEKVTNNV